MPRKMKVIKTEKRSINGRECEVVTIGLESKRRETKWIGCPMEFLQATARATKGKATLLLALVIYRRCKVQKSQTVTLPPDELAALGILRSDVHRALRQLQAAGLIQLHPIISGHKAIITLSWPR